MYNAGTIHIYILYIPYTLHKTYAYTGRTKNARSAIQKEN